MVFTVGQYQLVLFQVRRHTISSGARPAHRIASAAEIERRLEEHQRRVAEHLRQYPRAL